jgi:opacity protein-like surface antigen
MKKFISLFLATFALIEGSLDALCNGCDIYRVRALSGLNFEVFGGWACPELPTTNNTYAEQKKNENYVWGGTFGVDFGLPGSCWLFGAEGSYINLGRTKYKGVRWQSDYYNLTIKSYGWQCLGKLTYVFFSGWNVFLKAGGTWTSVYSTHDYPNTVNDERVLKKWLPTVAAGFGLMPCQNMTISLQYEHLFGQQWKWEYPSSLRRPYTQDIITLNLSYKINFFEFLRPKYSNCNFGYGRGCCN